MRLSIKTTGAIKPECTGGNCEVLYKMLTSGQLEDIFRLTTSAAQSCEVWRKCVQSIDGETSPTFVIDGVDKQVNVTEVPDYPCTYSLVFEVGQRILMESMLTQEEKKTGDSSTR